MLYLTIPLGLVFPLDHPRDVNHQRYVFVSLYSTTTQHRATTSWWSCHPASTNKENDTDTPPRTGDNAEEHNVENDITITTTTTTPSNADVDVDATCQCTSRTESPGDRSIDDLVSTLVSLVK
mmetsp:Transcript_51433/g.55676  ORF Transcript_51433/g.55676 Transcript_51433/m.55676 type:complete len:123 (+) Transcript_51433:396-764(+)